MKGLLWVLYIIFIALLVFFVKILVNSSFIEITTLLACFVVFYYISADVTAQRIERKDYSGLKIDFFYYVSTSVISFFGLIIFFMGFWGVNISLSLIDFIMVFIFGVVCYLIAYLLENKNN